MKDFQELEKIRNNMCEYPYEFENAQSKARFMLTTAQTIEENGGYNSLPRIGTGQPGMRTQQGFNTVQSNASAGRLRYGGRGQSAGAMRPYPIIR